MKRIFGTLFPKGSSEGIRGVFIPVRDGSGGGSGPSEALSLVVVYFLLSWWVLGDFAQAIGFSVLVGILSLFGLGGIVAFLVLGGGIVWKALQWGPEWIHGILIAVLAVIGLFAVVTDSTRFWFWRCAVLLVGIAVWYFKPLDPLVALIDRHMRPETDLAGRGLAGSSAEWIQDWGVATNRTRMTARLGRDSSGPTLTIHDRFCGSCSDGNPLASPAKSPRYTVQIGKCSSETGRVRCDAISNYHADPSLGAIRTTFELDFSKRSGQLTFYSNDGSTLVNSLYYTPSSLSGAPAWLRAQSRAIGGSRDRSVAQPSTPTRGASPIETHIGNIALSRNGQWIAVSRGMDASEQTFAILDAASGKQLAEAVTLHGKGLAVGKDKLAISSDGQFVAFAVSSVTNSVPPELYLYSVARGAAQYQRTLPAAMMGICFSADGRRIFTTSGNQLFEFDAGSGRELSRLEFGSRNAYYLASFATAARVLAVYEDGSNEAAVWDFGGSVSRRRALKASAKITSMDLSSDGTQLAVGDASGAVSLFDTTTGLEILHRDGFGGNVLGVRVTPDGRRLAVGVQNGVKFLSIASGEQIAELQHRESIFPWTISLSEDGKKLAAVDGKFRPVFWALQQ